MQGNSLYEYAIIRLVPQVERGEFINIGVILMDKKNDFLRLRYELNKERLEAFSKEIDIEMIKEYLTGWEKVCAGSKEGGKIGNLEIRVRFRWLTANRSTIIQSSPVHPGFSNDPVAELDKLMTKFVL